MKTIKIWKYLFIGMVIAVLFGVTLNIGWETVFINFFIGFATSIIKSMRKDYDMKYAVPNYGLPIFVAGILVSILISLSIG